jgi:hypothetical protein
MGKGAAREFFSLMRSLSALGGETAKPANRPSKSSTLGTVALETSNPKLFI